MADQHFDVPVDGGALHVGLWGTRGPVVLAAHGITANHVSFEALADQVKSEVRLIAPDLRGRGRSADITGPWGMSAHAKDLVCVLDHLRLPRADLLLGHSMGGFVAAVAAAEYPERFARVLLVDGGLPLMKLPPLHRLPFGNFLVEKLVNRLLGPSIARLDMTFASREAYHAYWRAHPSLKNDWSPYVERYIDYDLIGAAPALRSCVRKGPLFEDVRTQLIEDLVPRSLKKISAPVHFLRAPRGILNGAALYAPQRLAKAARPVAHFSSATVDDVNHYTIMLGARGAGATAAEVRRLVSRA